MVHLQYSHLTFSKTHTRVELERILSKIKLLVCCKEKGNILRKTNKKNVERLRFEGTNGTTDIPCRYGPNNA